MIAFRSIYVHRCAQNKRCIYFVVVLIFVTKFWLQNRGYRYYTLRKFYRRHYELFSKYDTELKALLPQGLTKSKFYGELVC